MDFWRLLSVRYEKETISGWTSLRKSGYILLPLFLYFLVHDLAEIFLWAVIQQLMIRGGSTADFLTRNAVSVQGVVNGLMIVLGVAAVWGTVRSEICRKEAGRTGISEKMITDYMLVAALAFCASIGLNLLFSRLGITGTSQTFQRAAKAQFGVSFLVGLILYGVVSPLAEEAVFRGVIYNRMKRCFHLPFALIVSSLLFGCYHGNLVQALYGTILGIMIAYVYERYESFAAPVLFHAVANCSVYVMTYEDSFQKIGYMAENVMMGVALAAMIICLAVIRKRA